jgi:transcriptional regulator with XRE-family HTH domain
MSNTSNIGSKISLLRKEKNWLQSDLAQKIVLPVRLSGSTSAMKNLLSIEMVAKMAKTFGITVDFLIGGEKNASYDKETVKRINDIQKMDADTKSVCSTSLISYIQNFKNKQAFR